MAFDFARWLAGQPTVWDKEGSIDSAEAGYLEYNLFRQRDLLHAAARDKHYFIIPSLLTVAGAIETKWRHEDGAEDNEVQLYHNPWQLRRDWAEKETWGAGVRRREKLFGIDY